MRALCALMFGSFALIAASCVARTTQEPARYSPAQGSVVVVHRDSTASGELQRSPSRSTVVVSEPGGPVTVQQQTPRARPGGPPAVEQPGRYSPRTVVTEPEPVTTPQPATSIPGKPRAAAAGAGFQIPPPDAGGIQYKGPKGGDQLDPVEKQQPIFQPEGP